MEDSRPRLSRCAATKKLIELNLHDMKTKLVAVTLLACASVAFAACDGDGDGNGTPTPQRTPTAERTVASPTPRTSPTPSAETGKLPESVLRAIELVEAGDFEAVEGMFQFDTVACAVDVMGAGGPPECEADEADGTQVEVLPVAQCEGAYLRPQDVFLAQRMRGQQPGLFAVYEAPLELFPDGDYAVVFSYVRPEMPGPTLAFELMMDDAGVTGINFGCGEDPATLVAAQALGTPVATPTALP
jgi:hypothetical protein